MKWKLRVYHFTVFCLTWLPVFWSFRSNVSEQLGYGYSLLPWTGWGMAFSWSLWLVSCYVWVKMIMHPLRNWLDLKIVERFARQSPPAP